MIVAAIVIPMIITSRTQAYGLRPSKIGKSNCHDNASVETFFQMAAGGADLALEMADTAKGDNSPLTFDAKQA